jgi:hypothetical protein
MWNKNYDINNIKKEDIKSQIIKDSSKISNKKIYILENQDFL